MPRSATAWTVLLAILAALGACTSIGPPGGAAVEVSESRARALAASGDYTTAATMYETLATDRSAEDASRLSLLSALAWLEAGDDSAAREALTRAERDATARETVLLTLVRSGIAVADGDGVAALSMLDGLADDGLSLDERLAYQSLRARALFSLDQPAQAVQYLMRREYWLNDERAVSANHQAIWDGLRATPQEILESERTRADDPDVRGWLDLVAATNPVREDDRALRQAVLTWTRIYPRHPANSSFVPALIGSGVAAPGEMPARIALMLPLDGRQRGAAVAVRDGFVAAHIADSPVFNAPQVDIYDYTGDGALLTYERAVSEGANVVVGPLTKPSVEEMTYAMELPVPLIALNDIGTPATVLPGFYQFALAPEDEARAIARRAAMDADLRAVALVPIGDWGDRLIESFGAALATHGGQLLDFERYDPAETDFSTEIERVMQIRSSIVRHRNVSQLVGESLQFVPRRRQDVDYIFLAANSASARLIKPQLRFHFSGDLPVYSTTAVYSDSGDGRGNSDLNGVRFTEIPWLIAPGDAPEPGTASYERHWHSQPQAARLFAFGLDAYRLVEAILVDGFESPLAGATGELTLDVDNRVRRRPAFGEFVRGEAQRLPEPEISLEGDMLEPPPEWREATGSD